MTEHYNSFTKRYEQDIRIDSTKLNTAQFSFTLSFTRDSITKDDIATKLQKTLNVFTQTKRHGTIRILITENIFAKYFDVFFDFSKMLYSQLIKDPYKSISLSFQSQDDTLTSIIKQLTQSLTLYIHSKHTTYEDAKEYASQLIQPLITHSHMQTILHKNEELDLFSIRNTTLTNWYLKELETLSYANVLEHMHIADYYPWEKRQDRSHLSKKEHL